MKKATETNGPSLSDKQITDIKNNIKPMYVHVCWYTFMRNVTVAQQ